MTVKCTSSQCRRGTCAAPLFCKCGSPFCTEACFIQSWHAEHQRSCPNASEIKAEIGLSPTSTDGRRRKGSQLASVALSRSTPTSKVATENPENASSEVLVTETPSKVSTASDSPKSKSMRSPPKLSGTQVCHASINASSLDASTVSTPSRQFSSEAAQSMPAAPSAAQEPEPADWRRMQSAQVREQLTELRERQQIRQQQRLTPNCNAASAPARTGVDPRDAEAKTQSQLQNLLLRQQQRVSKSVLVEPSSLESTIVEVSVPGVPADVVDQLEEEVQELKSELEQERNRLRLKTQELEQTHWQARKAEQRQQHLQAELEKLKVELAKKEDEAVDAAKQLKEDANEPKAKIDEEEKNQLRLRVQEAEEIAHQAKKAAQEDRQLQVEFQKQAQESVENIKQLEQEVKDLKAELDSERNEHAWKDKQESHHGKQLEEEIKNLKDELDTDKNQLRLKVQELEGTRWQVRKAEQEVELQKQAHASDAKAKQSEEEEIKQQAMGMANQWADRSSQLQHELNVLKNANSELLKSHRSLKQFTALCLIVVLAFVVQLASSF